MFFVPWGTLQPVLTNEAVRLEVLDEGDILSSDSRDPWALDRDKWPGVARTEVTRGGGRGRSTPPPPPPSSPLLLKLVGLDLAGDPVGVDDWPRREGTEGGVSATCRDWECCRGGGVPRFEDCWCNWVMLERRCLVGTLGGDGSLVTYTKNRSMPELSSLFHASMCYISLKY